MTAMEIKIQLMQAGVSPSQIARRLGVTPAAVTMVIAGDTTSARIRREIASVIGLPPERVFPARDTAAKACVCSG